MNEDAFEIAGFRHHKKLKICRYLSQLNGLSRIACVLLSADTSCKYPKKFRNENPKRCKNVSTIYYSIFIWSSTCFGRHTAHHQEPKTSLAATGFFTRERLLDMQMVDVARHSVPDNVNQLHVQQPSTYEKPEGASAILGSWWWAVCRPKHVELHINME
jgi:hypothetical protein